MKYKKKPIVIDAIQLDLNDEYGLFCFKEWVQPYLEKNDLWFLTGSDQWQIRVKTLEGNMIVNTGDWLIAGVAGELYPCKDYIFQATYEKVDDWAQECPACTGLEQDNHYCRKHFLEMIEKSKITMGDE